MSRMTRCNNYAEHGTLLNLQSLVISSTTVLMFIFGSNLAAAVGHWEKQESLYCIGSLAVMVLYFVISLSFEYLNFLILCRVFTHFN